MKTTYFLFGKEACEALWNDGIDELISLIEDNIKYELFVFTPETNPCDLLYKYSNYKDYSVITETEYNQLKDL